MRTDSYRGFDPRGTTAFVYRREYKRNLYVIERNYDPITFAIFARRRPAVAKRSQDGS